MGLFDVHAHLTHPRFDADRDAAVQRARDAGLTSVVCNGLNPGDNAAVLALAARHPDVVRPALGLYPVDAVLPEMLAQGVEYHRDDTTEPPPADAAIGWLEDHVEQAFAVGEIGLDHYWVPESLWALQEEHFRRLVRLAMDADKAVIIHTRKAERRAFEVLQELGAQRVVWHCYSSKVKLGEQIAAHGHWLSIPANVRKAENFQRLAARLPRDKVLLETDCPYLGPERGARNEPANVSGTADYLAETWAEPADAVQRQLEDNYAAVFHSAP